MERLNVGKEYMEATQTLPAKVAELSYGRGKVGLRYPLEGPESEQQFAHELGEHTRPLTKTNVAFCIDERLITRFAKQAHVPDDPNRIITHLLPGGTALATTKALVAANASLIRDAKSFPEAYFTTAAFLEELGYENAGHEGCGAAAAVESSVENEIDDFELKQGIGLFVPRNEFVDKTIDRNSENKRRLLQNGFFSLWTPDIQKEHLLEQRPENFAYLQDDPEDHETHGHNASGIYVVTRENMGFQKNGKAFGLTTPIMHELAFKLGGSDEERLAILVGFADDALHISAGLVKPGMPVFAQQ